MKKKDHLSLHLFSTFEKQMGISNLPWTCYICALPANQSVFHPNKEAEHQGNISSFRLLGLFLAFVSCWKKKLTGDEVRSVLFLVSCRDHYTLSGLAGHRTEPCMCWVEEAIPREMRSHAVCNPFICMDITYLSSDTRGKNFFLLELKRKMRYFLSKNTHALCVVTQQWLTSAQRA